MKKIFYILSLCLLLSVACEKSNPNDENPVEVPTSLTYVATTIADHDAVIVRASDFESGAPVVVVLAEDLKLSTRSAEKIDINFKAAEHCLIGGYVLCVIEAASGDDISFLSNLKSEFPYAPKFYLLSYRNGLAYTAAMQMPDAFAAYACVSGAIDVETYKANSFNKPVSFVHVHATENPVCKWEGVENKTVSVPLSVGAIVAINECLTFKTSEVLPREGKGRVTCTRYTDALSGCDVMLYSVESANSGWCDEEFEVYNQIWNFLKTH